MSMLISLRDRYGDTLVELGKVNPDIIVMDADLSYSTRTIKFKNAFPDRFFDMGISEQDMMGTAAGLAASGKIVFASTFAIFATGRPWEQIRTTIASQNLNVKIVATHGGISVGEDGHTHQAPEDIGLMRIIPNMKVIVPCDDDQTEIIIRKAVATPGPFYIRLTKPKLPKIYRLPCSFDIGKAVELRGGNHLTGKDVALLAIGQMVGEALEASKILKNRGISASVYDMCSVKPIDEETILEISKKVKAIITCEDHTVIGGLGDAVGEVVMSKLPIPVYKIGIQDRFGRSGSSKELYQAYGLDAQSIAKKVIRFIVHGLPNYKSVIMNQQWLSL